MPVMGLIFLRHAYSRYLAVKPADRGRPAPARRRFQTRALTKEDFGQQGAIFLRPEAQFDHLVSLPDSADRAAAIVAAMDGIEADYVALKRRACPRPSTTRSPTTTWASCCASSTPRSSGPPTATSSAASTSTSSPSSPTRARTTAASSSRPISIVQMIANLIEPERGTVLDPACGSGGMFVQSSANLVERNHGDPTKALTFYGMEKNATTIKLAQMNLAVHGLQGNIAEAISYYEDPTLHELLGKADYVMANPPFNVDEVDARKRSATTRGCPSACRA
jgi:type I restriction enzyme M protein